MILITFSAALTTVPAASPAEEVYRWVDDSGNVYYSDAEPLDVDSDRVLIEPPDADALVIERAEQPRPPMMQTVSLATAGLGPCALARQQLTLLHANVAIYRDDSGLWQGGAGAGDRSWLADASRPNAIRAARNAVLRECSSPAAVAAELEGEDRAP